MKTFLDILSWVWMVGGILLLPFNSILIGVCVTQFFSIKAEVWLEASKKLWLGQILWNLLFFSLCTFTHNAKENAEEAKTYTLTRIERPLSPETRSAILKEEREGWATERDKHYLHDKIWEYHFYNAKGEEIIDDSKKATPFQKAMQANGIEKLNKLSEEDARAYIDDYNTDHGEDHFYDIFVVIFSAVAFPFFLMLAEAFVIALLWCFAESPILATIIGAAIFGPSLYKIFKASRS